VGDDAVDVLVVRVGGRVLPRQHVLGIEHVEALVLHRTHVEVAHRDDHVVVEIHLQAEAPLVPGHAFLQRRHGVAALVELARLDIHREAHLAARCRGEAVLQHVKLRRDQGEQVGRLGERIFPARPVAVSFRYARGDEIAVGQQLRKALAVGVDGACEARHDVGPVRVEGDAAKALCLALREVAVLRAVEAGELGVLVGVDANQGFQGEAVGQRRVQGQAFVADGVARWRDRRTVSADFH
jgi:hypothetical protein